MWRDSYLAGTRVALPCMGKSGVTKPSVEAACLSFYCGASVSFGYHSRKTSEIIDFYSVSPILTYYGRIKP